MSQRPVFKVFAQQGCNTYLIGCPTTRRALLVDPKVGGEESYRAALAALDLTLAAVVDTHTHADHLSSSVRFLSADVPLYMSHRTPVERHKTAVKAGDTIEIGTLTFEVREVPGHTVDSIALVGDGYAFTGDSLLIDGLARADFRGSEPATLFESVRRELLTLPDATLVFPGHDYAGLLFTTIGHEKAHNPALQHVDGAAFEAALGAVEGEGNSKAVDQMLMLNVQADPDLPETAPNAAACSTGGGGGPVDIDELAPEAAGPVHASIPSPARWIDVREPNEWNAMHIPGTTHIPLSEIAFHLGDLAGDDPLYISCRSGARSMTVARTLKRLGIATHPVNVGGGILAWQAQGLPVEH